MHLCPLPSTMGLSNTIYPLHPAIVLFRIKFAKQGGWQPTININIITEYSKSYLVSHSFKIPHLSKDPRNVFE